jgi:hypothetical protein
MVNFSILKYLNGLKFLNFCPKFGPKILFWNVGGGNHTSKHFKDILRWSIYFILMSLLDHDKKAESFIIFLFFLVGIRIFVVTAEQMKDWQHIHL